MFFNLIHFILTVTHSVESNEMNLVRHLKKKVYFKSFKYPTLL